MPTDTSIFHSYNEDFEVTRFVAGIFPRKHVSIIASKAGVGKTWFLLCLGSEVSRGGTILGGIDFEAEPQRVLYFAGETGLSLILERIQKFPEKPDPLRFAIISSLELAMKGQILDIDSKEGINHIYDIITAFAPDLVIFDTLMSFRFGDENSNKDATMAIQRLKALAEKTDTAIIVAHHLRKRGKKEMGNSIDQDEIIGGSALVRFSANAFIMTKEERVRVLHCVKTWWEIPERLSWSMESTGGGFEMRRVSNDSTEIRLRFQKYINTKKRFSATEAAKDLGLSRTSIYYYINATPGIKRLDNGEFAV